MSDVYDPGYLDIVVYMARKYHGAPKDWRWRFKKQAPGPVWTYQGSSVKSEVFADGGAPQWHVPELNQLEFRVTHDQYMAARADYEHDTGKCAVCHGRGKCPVSIVDQDHWFDCDSCGGSGAATGLAARDLEKHLARSHE